MDNDLIAYRRKHKRCRYCEYNGYIHGLDSSWCHAKEKKKADWVIFTFFQNIQGWLCTVYKPKED